MSSGTPGSSGSAEDRNSMVDTIASSSTSRASTGSRMLRSTTVDEDDGWSTDFSLSDEEMGSETYLDHVEVSRNARDESRGLTFSLFLLALTLQFETINNNRVCMFVCSHYVAATWLLPTTLPWDPPKLLSKRATYSTWFASVVLVGGTSVLLVSVVL